MLWKKQETGSETTFVVCCECVRSLPWPDTLSFTFANNSFLSPHKIKPGAIGHGRSEAAFAVHFFFLLVVVTSSKFCGFASIPRAIHYYTHISCKANETILQWAIYPVVAFFIYVKPRKILQIWKIWKAQNK